jgi:N utilization substance protein B
MPLGSRRQAREIALQILYQLDVQEQLSDDQALQLFWRNLGSDPEEASAEPAPAAASATPAHLDEAHRAFAEQLVRGVRRHLAVIDEAITRASRNWRLERMARVDRNLLRLAVYELMFEKDVPAKAAINEAIEIAKRFGTGESPAFINGILDKCLAHLGGRDP